MITTVTLNPAVDKRYLVERFTPYAVQRVKECTATAGGKGLNVAKVAGLLGEQVLASGFAGGHSGRWILAELDRLGVPHDFVLTQEETRSCINIQDLATGRHTELLEPGASITRREQDAFLEKFDSLIEKSELITISGSLPQGVDPTLYSQMVRRCRGRGRPVLVDTSGSLLSSVLESRPTLVKPNTDELEQLLGRRITSRREVVDCAGRLHQQGIPLVVVSLGKEGAVLACREGIFQGSTPDLPAVNTVGCGDSMVAGFAVGLVRGLPIEETFSMALAVSTANALTPETGWFVQEDYRRLLGQVSCRRIG